jgi:hypothetical protein
MRLHALCCALAVLAATGCGGYFYETNINAMQPGMTKERFLQHYSNRDFQQPVLRASNRDGTGALIEVLTIDMVSVTHAASQVIRYWFLFREGVLEHWGQPAQWSRVEVLYDIDFQPHPTRRSP